MSATEAAKSFGRLVDRVREEHVAGRPSSSGQGDRSNRANRTCLLHHGGFKRLIAALPHADGVPDSHRAHHRTAESTPQEAEPLGAFDRHQRAHRESSAARSIRSCCGTRTSMSQIAIAAITASELLHGVHRLTSAVSRMRAERFVEQLLDSIPVVSINLDVARVHARLDAELSAKGASVGDAGLDDRGNRHLAGLPRRDAPTCAASPGSKGSRSSGGDATLFDFALCFVEEVFQEDHM